MSSANVRSLAWESTEVVLFTNRMKRSGDNTVPCGTPDEEVNKEEREFAIFTKMERSTR